VALLTLTVAVGFRSTSSVVRLAEATAYVGDQRWPSWCWTSRRI